MSQTPERFSRGYWTDTFPNMPHNNRRSAKIFSSASVHIRWRVCWRLLVQIPSGGVAVSPCGKATGSECFQWTEVSTEKQDCVLKQTHPGTATSRMQAALLLWIRSYWRNPNRDSSGVVGQRFAGSGKAAWCLQSERRIRPERKKRHLMWIPSFL